MKDQQVSILINKYPISEKEFRDIVYKKVQPLKQSFIDNISKLEAEIRYWTTRSSSLRLTVRNTYLYLDTQNHFLIPDAELFAFDNVFLSTKNLDKYFENKNMFGLRWELPTLLQLKSKANYLKRVFDKDIYFACKSDDPSGTKYVGYNPILDNINANIHVVTIIPIINLDYSTIYELIAKYLVPYCMIIDGLSSIAKSCLLVMSAIYEKFPNSIHYYDSKLSFCGDEFLIEEFCSYSDKTWMKQLDCELVDELNKIYERKNIKENDMDLKIKEELLNCEKIRADIDAYEEKLLKDPNRGHWDLWGNDDQYTVEIDEHLVARNPLSDINENGVIAIDFGTKSTIVVYQSDIEHTLPMGIGSGNLKKEDQSKRFENPTVMHFVNLETFLNDYKSRKGRPKTKWDDLTISHTAMDQFANSKSEQYYEYLHQIKQWAGQRKKKFRVLSNDGKTFELPAFLDLDLDDENALNPIEIYAYYIGLYINNMRKGHGIFLDYYLSFPVTYETKIREKIVKSFEKGLKKSLPSLVLENEEVMKKFHVNGDISEPTAYAVCALQEYGFDPDDDEEFFYGIFDFGGGTTDFDFGLWRKSAKRRYDYTIENFGGGGDPYLGGENLLEMLAFEVFKDNQPLMIKKGYTFTLAPKCTEFVGSDALLADSQEAEKNMHNLMEKIRPYWEQQDESENQESESQESESQESESQESENDDLKFVLTLFDKDGNDYPKETLHFSRKKLNNIIESRIREGVDSFFYSLKSALQKFYQSRKVSKISTINILLAGNSCKSPVVKRIFDEAIDDDEYKLIIKNQVGQIDDDPGVVPMGPHAYEESQDQPLLKFEIFPPLGTEESYKKMESKGLNPSRDGDGKPTGKTGVAFGLIQCRVSGSIERLVNSNEEIAGEIPFQYYIGWKSKKKFVPFKDDVKTTQDEGKLDYNEWYKFIEADVPMFEIYYTTLPDCISGELLVDNNPAVKHLRCPIDVVDEAFVYVRAINPHTLEYVVAKENNGELTTFGNSVRKEL